MAIIGDFNDFMSIIELDLNYPQIQLLGDIFEKMNNS